MPEEPLHVLVEGKKESADRAETLVRELLEDREAAVREKSRQLGSMNPDSANAGEAVWMKQSHPAGTHMAN